MRGRLGVLRDALRTQLWLLPVFGVGVAVAAGVLLPYLDAKIADDIPPWATIYLFGGGASAARTVMEVIAGSLITVTSLTFSLTVVTLQLASSQYSPRLLRTFSSDRFIQFTLALFLTTFTYTLTVLRSIRSSGEYGGMFVPQVSVTTGLLLALASVLALVLFLAHLAREVRVETLLRKVHAEAGDTLRRVLPPRSSAPDDTGFPSPPPDALLLYAPRSGFMVRLDEQGLLSAALDAGAVLRIDSSPGSQLIAGTPVGAAWPQTTGSFSPETRSRLTRQVAKAIRTRFERTAAHDVTYGVRQITDIVTRALSPGINDPTTAVHALNHSSALLCELAQRRLGPHLLRDGQGQARVLLHRPDLDDLLELVLAQPRRYGAGDPIVLAQFFTMLRDLAWHAAEDQRPAIARQLARLRAVAAEQDFDAAEQARLAEFAGQAEHALAGRWAPAKTPR